MSWFEQKKKSLYIVVLVYVVRAHALATRAYHLNLRKIILWPGYLKKRDLAAIREKLVAGADQMSTPEHAIGQTVEADATLILVQLLVPCLALLQHHYSLVLLVPLSPYIAQFLLACR